MIRPLVWIPVLLVLVFFLAPRPFAQDRDVVLNTQDFTIIHGNWAVVESPSSPGGRALSSANHGWDTRPTALEEPADYVEATFSTEAQTPYRVWLRLKAADNSKWNDSVWVQFGDAVDQAGAAAFAIGTATGLLVNLESCYACGDRGWGWQDHAWWTGQSAVVQFPTAGPHTIRIQTREDGVQVDQVVLSPAAYLETAPGDEADDATIVPRSAAGAAGSPSSAQPVPPAVAATPPFSTAPTPAPAPAPRATSGTATTTGTPSGQAVAVLTWNIDISLQNDAAARQQMDSIASLQPLPRILVLEEASRSLYATYLSELQARTGEAWTGVFQQHCAIGGWDDNAARCTSPQDEGVAILTTFPVVSKDTRLLPYADCWHSARGAVHAGIDVNGVTVHVYGTHLPTGSCTDVQAARGNAVGALMNWASRSPSPRIAAGDFNASGGSPEIANTAAGMAAMFTDTWPAFGKGPSGTYPAPSATDKIDYWFQDRSGKARAVSSRVETGMNGSDHYPLSASFVFTR